jgi:hypothetical protein
MSIFSKEAKPSLELLKAEHPDIYKEAVALGETAGQADMEAKITTARAEGHEKGETQGMAEGEKIGAKNELARCLAVQAQSQPGHEKLIAGMVADGKSTSGQAAEAVIAAQNDLKAKGLQSLKDNSPDPVEPDPTDETPPADGDPLKAAWDGKDGKELKAEFGGDYDGYKGYFENDEKFKATGKISLPA